MHVAFAIILHAAEVKPQGFGRELINWPPKDRTFCFMSLYTSTQRFLRTGFRMFYRKVDIVGMENIPASGPVLLVSNHPNSFMDALVIGSYLPRPLNFLARGDAFNNPVLRKIFEAYHMLPVYRISEGRENIEKNFDTFDACYRAVEQNQMVLIFGEGLCKNNYELRPMKKGAARIAQRAWSSGSASEELTVVPVGLTYQHFSGPGKSVLIRYGKPFSKADFSANIAAPDFTQQFNARISEAITGLAYVNNRLIEHTPEHHAFVQAWVQAEKQSADVLQELKKEEKKGSSGLGLHRIHASVITLPHYWLSKAITGKLTKGSVFYDSILFGMYWFLLPLYLMGILALVLYFV